MTRHNNKFLVIDDSEDALEVIELFIEGEFNNEIVTTTSGNKAIEILKEDPHYAIIVSDYNMPEGTGEILYQYLLDQKIDTPFILLCGEEIQSMKDLPVFKPLTNQSSESFIEKPFKKNDLTNLIKTKLKYWDENKTEKFISPIEYKKINIDKFFKFNLGNKKVFIRLGNEKFLKIIEEKESFDSSKDILEKYARKGIKHLYLLSKDYEGFLGEINNNLIKALTTEPKNVSEALNNQYNAIENIHEGLLSLGISETTISLANAAIDTTIKLLKKSPNLAFLINQMIQNKNFVYDLAMLNSYIATSIARQTEWATESSYQKLAKAAFIQDISLDNPDWAKIMDLDSEGFKKLSKEDQQLFVDHPTRSVALLDETNDFSGDCRTIILEHHELPDGNGFPGKLTSQKISPLSCIMIISNHFSYSLLINGQSKENIEKTKKEIENRFNKGNFKRPFQGFLKMMENFFQK